MEGMEGMERTEWSEGTERRVESTDIKKKLTENDGKRGKGAILKGKSAGRKDITRRHRNAGVNGN